MFGSLDFIFVLILFSFSPFRSHGSSVELTLPDNLFASIEKPAEGSTPDLSTAAAVNESTGISATPSSEINIELPDGPATDVASH